MVVEHERQKGVRVVEEDLGFVCHCPFASRFPYEMTIHPLKHSPDLADLEERELEGLAAMIMRTIGRLEAAFPEPDFNLVLHTAPFAGDHGYYHWHFEVLPRLTITAGL